MIADSVTTTAGTVGTSATNNVVTLSPQRKFLQIHNPDTAKSLAFTFDGTAPIVNGNGITLGPLTTATYDYFVPRNAINIIGSASASPYTILVVQ